MCEDSGLEGGSSNGDFSQPRSSLRGPLILAKLVVDALEKKQQVRYRIMYMCSRFIVQFTEYCVSILQ